MKIPNHDSWHVYIKSVQIIKARNSGINIYRDVAVSFVIRVQEYYNVTKLNGST